MKITALAPWYGSKRTLAPRIVEQLGEHRAYWEPFCGSCAVLFAKPVSCTTSARLIKSLCRSLTLSKIGRAHV